MEYTGQMTCELKLDTLSPGWQKTFTKVLKGIKGLSFTIDAERGIARLSGKIDPDTLLQIMAKAGKHVDLLWVDSGIHKTPTTTATATAASNVGRTQPTMIHDYGYGYGYNGYDGGYVMYEPQPRYLYSQYQNYGVPNYYNPLPPPPYQYYEQPARYFPQAPPPVPNARLESLCNLM